MMFKRPRLSATTKLVNASQALALLFVAASCSDSGTSPPETPVTPETPTQTAAIDNPAGLNLPAVWNTARLNARPTSIGITGGLGSRFAIADENGALQIFDFEAERLTEPVELDVAHIADGQFAVLSGTGVSLFPGINNDGDIRLYVHGGNLSEPIEYAFDIEQSGEAAGLCVGAPERASDGILRLGYWTASAPETLQTGRIVEVRDQLVFLANEPVSADRSITACILQSTGATVFSEPVRDAAMLERLGNRHMLTLDSSGNMKRITAEQEQDEISIRDGLSVDMPALPVDFAGTGDARSGGYPGGLVVVVGETEPEAYRAVLIDPSQITLDPFRP